MEHVPSSWKALCGAYGRGILPGGLHPKGGAWGSAWSRPREVLPGFRRSGIDVIIKVEVLSMLRDDYQILRSDQHVILTPEVVYPKYVERIQVLPKGITLFKRVPVERQKEAP